MSTDFVYCGECGTKNEANSGFCGNCGTQLAAPAKATPESNIAPQGYQQPPQGYQQPPQGYQQPPQGYQQPPQGYQQPPQGYQQPMGYQQGYNQPVYTPGAMGYQKPRKDPGLGYVGALFIPGFAYLYTDDIGTGIVATIITYFLYGFLIGFFIHIYLFATAGGKVKDYNRLNGYPE